MGLVCTISCFFMSLGGNKMDESQVFEAALQETLKYEGGYVNDPDDRGGETNYGVTEKVARAYGYEGDMKDLTYVDVKPIYRQEYWLRPKFHKLVEISPRLAQYVFDMGVNMGPRQAVKYLQVAIRYIKPAPGLSIDGLIGPKTLGWLAGLSRAQRDALFSCVVYKHIDHYLKIVQINPKQRKFLNGWMRRVGVDRECKALKK